MAHCAFAPMPLFDRLRPLARALSHPSYRHYAIGNGVSVIGTWISCRVGRRSTRPERPSWSASSQAGTIAMSSVDSCASDLIGQPS